MTQDVSQPPVILRPVVEADLDMFRRFATEPDLFHHTPNQRIQAGTQPENIAEQKALEKAGFQLEGVLRACEFRTGQWRDGLLYSRLRTDPPPTGPR